MPIEGITCDQCGSSDVTEFKPNTYACSACEHIFKYVDPTHAEVEVAPQFCEEGCGNPVGCKCSLCGNMACNLHGKRAYVWLAGRAKLTQADLELLAKTALPKLQSTWCISCAGQMNRTEIAEYLVLALEDYGSPEARLAAAIALGRIGDPIAIDGLGMAAQTDMDDVERAAIESLGNIGDVAAMPFLIERIKRCSNESTQMAAIDAAGEIGSEAIPILANKILQDTDWFGNDHPLQIYTVNVLARKGGSSVIPEHIWALTNGGTKLKIAAADALGDIGDSSAVPYLVDELNNEYEDIRMSSAKALGKIGDADAVPQLIRAMKAPKNANWNRVVLHNRTDVRSEAARALLRIGDPKGVSAVKKSMRRARLQLDD